jgi:hypothetical protein
VFSPQEFVGGIANLVMFFLVIAAVWKLFQIGTDLGEIKNALLDIKRSQQEMAPPPIPSASSSDGELTPEELVRRVHAQDFSSDDVPVLDPTILPPR